MRGGLLVYIVLFFFLSFQQKAQNDSALKLNQKQWKELSEGIDYTENFKDPENDKKETNLNPDLGVDLSDFKYLFYIIALGILVFLIVKVFNNFKTNPDTKEKNISLDSIKEIEDHIHEVNLEELLRQALLIKNYRIALRLNFLIIIKLLSQKEKISWAKEKTNWEYYSELSDKLLADQFRDVIKSFELFWYGEHALTELKYQEIESSLKALQKRLAPNE